MMRCHGLRPIPEMKERATGDHDDTAAFMWAIRARGHDPRVNLTLQLNASASVAVTLRDGRRIVSVAEHTDPNVAMQLAALSVYDGSRFAEKRR